MSQIKKPRKPATIASVLRWAKIRKVLKVSRGHEALIASGAEQEPEDVELARRMAPIQWEAMTGRHRCEDETVAH